MECESDQLSLGLPAIFFDRPSLGVNEPLLLAQSEEIAENQDPPRQTPNKICEGAGMLYYKQIQYPRYIVADRAREKLHT